MINKLILEDFQGHANSELIFHPGVNVIIGESDTGKSSIIRSLLWVIKNNPNLVEYIRTGTKKAKASVYVDNHIISRIRGKNRNEYVLDDEVLKAFRREPPESVQHIFNMDDINFKKQISLPFLLSLSQSQLTKYINQLTQLSLMDEITAETNRRKYKTNDDIKSRKEDIDIISSKLDKLSDIRSIAKDYTTVARINNEMNELAEKGIKLAALVKKIESFKKPPDFTQAKTMIDKASKMWIRIHAKEEAIHKLESILNKIKDNRASNVLIKAQMEGANKRLKKIMPEVCPLCDQPIEEK